MAIGRSLVSLAVQSLLAKSVIDTVIMVLGGGRENVVPRYTGRERLSLIHI